MRRRRQRERKRIVAERVRRAEFRAREAARRKAAARHAREAEERAQAIAASNAALAEATARATIATDETEREREARLDEALRAVSAGE